jgi:hypothetical protein
MSGYERVSKHKSATATYLVLVAAAKHDVLLEHLEEALDGN